MESLLFEAEVLVADRPINVRFVDSETTSHVDASLYAPDASNITTVLEVARERLPIDLWFARPSFTDLTLKSKHRIELGPNTGVELFGFGEEALQTDQINKTAGALAIFYAALKDTSDMAVRTVQVMPKDEHNAKNNQPIRGRESPAEGRFELFPASFADGLYRGHIDCTWLEGAVWHESTHVSLEPKLLKLWNNHSQELGWAIEDDVLIELPGGHVTCTYNRDPIQCPTEYASLQQDDDRADSVVAFLSPGQKLGRLRHDLVALVVKAEFEAVQPVVEEQEPELPTNVTVGVVEKDLSKMIRFIGTSTSSSAPKPVVPLLEFRQGLHRTS